MQKHCEARNPELIGLLPAGGKATRVSPLPCSKEIYPVGFRLVDEGNDVRPKVVCHYLLERMRSAGVTRAHIVLRKGKWDIPAYLGNGKILGMHLSYLLLELPYGVPYTLDVAYPFIKDEIVVFGFPDIIFQPSNAFIQLLSRQARSNADVVLGLFPARQPQKVDMVELGSDGQILGIQIKPPRTSLGYTWLVAVWSSVFTDFMHEYVSKNQYGNSARKNNKIGGQKQELHLGEVIGASIKEGMLVDSVFFEDGFYLDIGTPEDLAEALKNEMIQGFPCHRA